MNNSERLKLINTLKKENRELENNKTRITEKIKTNKTQIEDLTNHILNEITKNETNT